MTAQPLRTVDFTAMADGTAEDYLLLREASKADRDHLADHVLALLEGLRGHNFGLQVDGFEHSLQTASRAFRDGADEEMVCVALLHDIGGLHAPENHSAFAAALFSVLNLALLRHRIRVEEAALAAPRRG